MTVAQKPGIRAIRFSTRLLTGLLLLSTSCNTVARNLNSEIILFPQFQIEHQTDLPSPAPTPRNFVGAGSDLFLSANLDQWRLIGELLLDTDERELERLQIGWQAKPGMTVWLGRFHNINGYWNTAYHHGTYLQTALTRPGITEYPDDGGPVAQHIAGLLIEKDWYSDTDRWGLDVAVGVGASLEENGLQSLDLLNLEKGSQRLAISARLRYYPDAAGPTEWGFFAGTMNIRNNTTGFNDGDQTQTGVYANLEQSPWRINAALSYLRNNLHTGSGADSFTNAYTQVEYELAADWTAYGRIEDSFSEKDDSYLKHFPGFTIGRTMTGIRYDFTSSHALTLEINHDRKQAFGSNRFLLYWTASLQ